MAQPARWDFFGQAEPGDIWFERVESWRSRERTDQILEVRERAETTDGAVSGFLRTKFRDFGAKEKQALARRFMAWAQEQARVHYRFDEQQDLAGDHWPTTRELFERDGDDCDGLDLIAYNLMLELGFGQHEVYRAIVRRDRDRENHMVTLWFEDRDDPWVIDATGAMTMKMRRLSNLPGWTPTKVFSADEHFTVSKRVGATHTAASD